MQHCMYVYPWDLWQEGTAEVAARLRGAGLDAVSLATAYHAGKFLRPHAPRDRVWFPTTVRSISGPSLRAIAVWSRLPRRWSRPSTRSPILPGRRMISR